MNKKFLSLILSFVLILGCVMNSNSVFATGNVNYDLVNSAEKIKTLSRCVLTTNGFEADFSGGGIAFNANCSGDVILNLDFKGDKGLISVVINNDFENAKIIKIENEGDQNILIAENLSKGNYYFEITKQNPYYINQVAFKTISLNGELLDKPLKKNLKLEFYGDSITAGVGTLSTSISGSGEPGYEDASLYSYASYCARNLDAEINMVGMPGYGYICGYDTGKNQNVYPFISRGLYNKSILFDNSSYIADVVVLALGTNDYNYIKKHKEVVEKAEMCEILQKYIDTVRSYNKDCVIVLIGSMADYDLKINDKANGSYINITYALKRAAAINSKVLYLDKLNMNMTGRGYHPTAEQASVGAKVLSDFINDNILSGKDFDEPIAPADYYLNCDLNDDDKVNILDAKRMTDYLVNNNRYKLDDKTADVNCDGVADLKDYLKIRKTIADQ